MTLRSILPLFHIHEFGEWLPADGVERRKCKACGWTEVKKQTSE